MGSISSEDLSAFSWPKDREVEAKHNGAIYDIAPVRVDGFKSKELNLASDTQEEVILLSWLLVLLRSQEGDGLSFEWSYGNSLEKDHTVERHHITAKEFASDLQASTEQCTAAIAAYLGTLKSQLTTPAAHSFPMLLSTGSLSRQSDKIQEEGTLHVQVHFSKGRLELSPLWFSDNFLPYTIRHLIETLAETIKTCLIAPQQCLRNALAPTSRDIDDIWSWNHELPPTHNFCMHDMIAERAHLLPDKIAIASWDGDLTFSQVDHYSTLIAHKLQRLNVQLHDFVPICFEKSRWTIVAVLAAMKVGATFVLMDPSLPLARLQNMASQVCAKVMISSRKQYELSAAIIERDDLIVVEEASLRNIPDQFLSELPVVPASTLMYLIFTSGSTGIPKGVKISHQTYTSSAIPRAQSVGYNKNSRVLDFASYAFDVSIDSMLLTLGNGGCLCIPSDEDRMNDINTVIRKMRVNYAGVTPSVARILDPDVINSLDILGLGGEAASARDVNHWGQDTRIVIGYGPCECTIGCTINSNTATGRDYISIGHGNGANIWIVDPNDHEILMPVGAVGEILVEGPIVGQGYLDDPEKTAAAFIKDPKWLVAGHKSYKGRSGRLYKSGDLGKYDPDGSGDIIFVGRKDTQVKLRGQRVELGEIESQLKARLPSETHVVVEVIVPEGVGAQPTLVSFIAATSTRTHAVSELLSERLSFKLRESLAAINTELAKVLPRYMVPTAYIPVNHIPILISGKVDRKRLKNYGGTVNLRDLDQESESPPSRELTEVELRLRKAWTQTLKIPHDIIRLEDNFFALGGDSLAAMRLVTACRAQGLELSVAHTFNNPTLSTMAEATKSTEAHERFEPKAFSMIAISAEDIRFEAAKICNVKSVAVEDIYPCTASQESLFTLSLRSKTAYVAQRVASIPVRFDTDTWKAAWQTVVSNLPILRTRVAQMSAPGLQQVILKENISWQHAHSLEDYLKSDRDEKMELGSSLARYAIVDDTTCGERFMVWTVHHVLYDGWSEPLILREVTNALQDQSNEIQAYMKDYVKYMRDTDQEIMHEYWRKELEGANGPQFPKMPSRDYMPTPDGMVDKVIKLPDISGSAFTVATLIRGAWALVTSQHTGSNDVVFGETLTGRDIPVPGVETIVGPLIATVPVRVQIDRSASVESYLKSVQRIMLQRTPYQHMGWQNIRKVSMDAQFAGEAGTGLVIQPNTTYDGSDLGFRAGDAVREALYFNPYPLMVAFGIQQGALRACTSFDTSLIKIEQMERIIEQLEATCHRLVSDLQQRVGDVSCISEAELEKIWSFNSTPPLSLDPTSKRIRANAAVQSGSPYPPAVVSWICDARNSSLLAPLGTVGELWLESDLLGGEAIWNPTWLITGSSSHAGRSGKVQGTGDLTRMQEDGTLLFVGCKEKSRPVNGHTVDVTELEKHLKRNLPADTSFFVTFALLARSDSKLVVFIEQKTIDVANVQILGEPVQIESEDVKVVTAISIELAVGLKTFEKFAHDSLPSYMAPFAYICLSTFPPEVTTLNEIASGITPVAYARIKQDLTTALSQVSLKTTITSNEEILRTAWSSTLRIPIEHIEPNDNFFRLGGDSVLSMKLAAHLRGNGYALSVADIFRHMKLKDAAEIMTITGITKENEDAYKPFSTLQVDDSRWFVRQNIQPKLNNAAWIVKDVAPVTDSQALDIRATISAPRTSYQYTMLFTDRAIDPDRLLRSYSELVKMHDILRTVFVQHETGFLQVVIQNLVLPVTLKKTTEADMEQYVKDICSVRAEEGFDLGRPFADLIRVEGVDGQNALVIGLSHAQYDGVSLPNLLRDLETLYVGDQVEKTESYPRYVSRTLDSDLQAEAFAYWTTLLKDSAMSALVGNTTKATDKALFQHRAANVTSKASEITTSSLLTAAWAVVLARRLQKKDVTFGSITSGRHLDGRFREEVQGPCYAFTPVRVDFQEGWHAKHLLEFVQNQAAESAAFDSFGYVKIARAVGWEEDSFFDSLVHHQDWDDLDTMPFAGSELKIDVLNPHGDAAHPLKVVSFVRGRETHVGVVGSERDPVFVDKVLDELVFCVEELAAGHDVSILT